MSKAKLFIMAVFGALAFSAVSSSLASANWMVGGATLTGTETKALATTAAVDENGTLTAAGVTITCSGSTLDGVNPEIEAGNIGRVQSLEFTSCSANENCAVATSISTLPISVTVAEGEGAAVIATFKPRTKTTFATIKFEGEKCALLGTQPVRGQAKIEAPTGQIEQTLQKIVANVKEELTIGSSTAVLKGSALLKLSNGAAWNFLGRAVGQLSTNGNFRNPFMLEAEIVSIVREPGSGTITGGTCKVDSHYGSLVGCTVEQGAPLGAIVTWLPL